MHKGKKPSSAYKKYPPGSFMDKLRKRRIIKTVAAFDGGGSGFCSMGATVKEDEPRADVIH